MKTGRLVIGIVSIVLFMLIAFQSCAAGLGNALAENGEVSDSAGIILAFFMLVAGIIAIAGRKSKAPSIVSGAFYILGGILALPNTGSFADLKIWGSLSLIFGIFFILSGILQKKPEIKANN